MIQIFRRNWKLLAIIAMVVVAAKFITTSTPPETNLRVAVASNFQTIAYELALEFRKQTGVKLDISSASTGILYNQITNGAPFDIFLSADAKHPDLLAENGVGDIDSLMIYAVGKIVLWGKGSEQLSCLANLQNHNFQRLAIANPKIAPYGQATKEVLQGLGLWDKYQNNLVFGNNISQVFLAVDTQNAQLGFIAMSDYVAKIQGREKEEECVWIPEDSLYQPLVQKALILQDSESAREFMQFLKSPKAAEIIKRAGYDLPSSPTLR